MLQRDAKETSAYQRRPTTQYAAQGSNPPIGALHIRPAAVRCSACQARFMLCHPSVVCVLTWLRWAVARCWRRAHRVQVVGTNFKFDIWQCCRHMRRCATVTKRLSSWACIGNPKPGQDPKPGPCFWAPGSCPGASSLVVCVLGWYLLRPWWVPCWSALAALVAGGVV